LSRQTSVLGQRFNDSASCVIFAMPSSVSCASGVQSAAARVRFPTGWKYGTSMASSRRQKCTPTEEKKTAAAEATASRQGDSSKRCNSLDCGREHYRAKLRLEPQVSFSSAKNHGAPDVARRSRESIRQRRVKLGWRGSAPGGGRRRHRRVHHAGLRGRPPNADVQSRTSRGMFPTDS